MRDKFYLSTPVNKYLQQRTLFAPQVKKRAAPDLGLIVVIPAYDEPHLLQSLISLQKCRQPAVSVEVIVVVNAPDNASLEVRSRNATIAEQARLWAKKNTTPSRRFHILHLSDLPAKTAGVGLARKIGMDEAAWRLERAKCPNGIIACFDADSRCDENYLVALTEFFAAYPKMSACSIYFEHPVQGADYPPEVYQAALEYEMHLRYFVQAQRWAGFPHAIQTVGSSMAVRCRPYQLQGGMPRKQAGEDFYFLHKFTKVMQHKDCMTTRICPSSRPSHRVPFGTGRAIQQHIAGQKQLTYDPRSFLAMKKLLDGGPLTFFRISPAALSIRLQSLEQVVQDYLQEQRFAEQVAEVNSAVAQRKAFVKRFWQTFNAFFWLKFVHALRDTGYADVPVQQAVRWLLSIQEISPSHEDIALLQQLRAQERAIVTPHA